MSSMIESTSNFNDEATVASVTLNSTTAVTVLAANQKRIYFDVNNDDSANGFWLRFYPASQDDIKHGIFITGKIGRRPFFEMKRDNIYTGEISAIAVTDAPTAYTTTF